MMAQQADSLTFRQREVLRLVLAGMTLREICSHLGIASTNAVNYHLLMLQRKGAIERQEPLSGHRKARSLKVTQTGLAALGLRCCPTCKGDGTVIA